MSSSYLNLVCLFVYKVWSVLLCSNNSYASTWGIPRYSWYLSNRRSYNGMNDSMGQFLIQRHRWRLTDLQGTTESTQKLMYPPPPTVSASSFTSSKNPVNSVQSVHLKHPLCDQTSVGIKMMHRSSNLAVVKFTTYTCTALMCTHKQCQ